MSPTEDPDQRGRSGGSYKPVVVESIEDDTGLLCVDILEMRGRDFGFCEFRRDPDDPYGWRPTGLGYPCILDSTDLAVDEACRLATPRTALIGGFPAVILPRAT